MGGQACVLYGAAEFSRDLDLALLVNEGNLERFRGLLAELQAVSGSLPAGGRSAYLPSAATTTSSELPQCAVSGTEPLVLAHKRSVVGKGGPLCRLGGRQDPRS